MVKATTKALTKNSKKECESMAKPVEFGIGFLTGRTNLCNIINNCYKDMIEQVKDYPDGVNLTIFILYDLEYQHTKREEFYTLKDDVYKKIQVKYITPEDIEEEKKILKSRYNLTKDEVDLFLGTGYARARNAIMYFALKRKIDYLLFWDDDEYPYANIKGDRNKIIWEKQNNILEHLNVITYSDVTIGHRCGNMSPVPYIEFEKDDIKEKEFKEYIDAVSNEVISWDKIKRSMSKEANGMSFAEKDITEGKDKIVLKHVGLKNWLYASGICLNLTHLDKIPAFYNPPNARGEDTFFCTLLNEAQVVKVPTYHFHDSFLRYTGIVKGQFPKKFEKIPLSDSSVGERFLKASIGWIKYKPLLMYIMQRKTYLRDIEVAKEQLKNSIEKINEIFPDSDFLGLVEELEKYDEAVQEHYQEYLKTNDVWNRIKAQIQLGIKPEN